MMIDQTFAPDLASDDHLAEIGFGHEAGEIENLISWRSRSTGTDSWFLSLISSHTPLNDPRIIAPFNPDASIVEPISNPGVHLNPSINNRREDFFAFLSNERSTRLPDYAGDFAATWVESIDAIFEFNPTLIVAPSSGLNFDIEDASSSEMGAFDPSRDFNLGNFAVTFALASLDDSPFWTDEVICEIETSGRSEIARRIRHLVDVIPSESDQDPMNLKSLRHLASFLIEESNIPDPEIFVTRDGLMQIEWETTNEESVAMEFLPDGWIQFAGISPRVLEGDGRGTISGVLPRQDSLVALSSFLTNIATN